jgi:hypothetical protein
MMMITRNEAIQLIQESSHYEHMIVVATLMYYLAKLLDEDVHLWELVGLLHDLDYDHVKHDMSLHGLVASETLKDKLPAEARCAIQCHDHRSGFTPKNSLDNALILADSLAHILDDLSEPVTPDNVSSIIVDLTIDKPWLLQNIQRSQELGIPQLTLTNLIIDIHKKMQQWIRVCPRCLSPHIFPQTQGVWIWSTDRYQCQDCQYLGNNFVEFRLDEFERLTDPL